MKYLMIVCEDENNLTDFADSDFDEFLALAGARKLEGQALARTGDATTVRDSGRLITDGPFAETKEQIAGYDVMECDSLEEAVELAARHPVAAVGAIEVRPFWSD
jgi:hypothetical protein